MGSLAAFSYDWVGGDISGLFGLLSQCDRPATQITDASQALSHQVSSMVGGGGWTGKAADAFSTAWDKDSTAGTQLAEVWTKIGSIAQQLAEELASLESALEGAAYQLEKQGIAVNTATGIPEPDTVSGGGACPDPQTLAARGKLADQYMTYRANVLNQATQARTHATNALYTVTEELLPPQFDSGQLTNDLDGIRGIWAAPTDTRVELEEALEKAANKQGKVDAAAWPELLEKHKVDGYNARLESSTINDLAESRAAVAAAEAKAADAPPESWLTKLFAGDSEGLGVLGTAGKAIDAIPYVGATVGGVIQVVQDRENHESWRHSLVDGAVSNGAALGVGIGVAAGVAAVGGTSIAAVAGGAILGGVAAVGVGDAVHNLIQENWGQDIDQHGVLGGLGHGTVDSLDKTRHDLAHYGDDILHLF
jgi:uncharacterized protein YukE